MALRITESPETTEVGEVHPDVDIYLEQNEDGSVDVMTAYSDAPSTASAVIRFFEDGSIARVINTTPDLFHPCGSDNLVVVE